MPPNSTWPAEAEILRPNGLGGTPPQSLMRRDNHIMRAIARLKPGVSIEQDLRAFGDRLTTYRFRGTWAVSVNPTSSRLIGNKVSFRQACVTPVGPPC